MTKENAQVVMSELDSLGDPDRAAHSQRFFKTGPGQYGEGDRFIGLPVPEQRRIAKKYRTLPLDEIDRLLASPIHEHRLTGLVILVHKFTAERTADGRQTVVAFYLAHMDRINNWDLVDLSAPKILGPHLFDHPSERAMLQNMVRSQNLWERRIAVLATWPMIRQKQFEEILALAEFLLHDPEDLMHKAVGWMLRELGKKDLAALEEFLDQHAGVMPRTMLRYSIERMELARRQHFMGRS